MERCLGKPIEVRLQGAISDLQAAEARYVGRTSCSSKYKKPIQYASTSDTDLAFGKLVEDIISNKSNIWTSSEVHENYLLHGGKGCRKAVFLQKHFDDKLFIFSAPGLSSLLVFCDTVPSVFKLIDDNDDDGMIQNISKAIHRECKNLMHDKNKYTIQVDKQTGINSVSAALISMLKFVRRSLVQTAINSYWEYYHKCSHKSANTTSNWTWCYPWQEKPCATIS